MTGRYRPVDRLVVGAGVFGLHAAHVLLQRGLTVAIVDLDPGPLLRASLVNQARVHQGYHYPRSAYTALQSAAYYDRFLADFPDAVNARFTKVYAVAATGSWTDAAEFERFCAHVGIRAQPADPARWFAPGAVEAAYETDEVAVDAPSLRRELVRRLDRHGDRLTWWLRDSVVRAERDADGWRVELASGAALSAGGVVNATYAGTNGVLGVFGLPPLPLKYELCEVALVKAPQLQGVGITVMDGPFFSVMPFGHGPLHSLTAVEHTPRRTSGDLLPTFACQSLREDCVPAALANCGTCWVRPRSAYPQMASMARRYLAHPDGLELEQPVHSVKVVLQTAEVDDARPTVVQEHAPGFTTIFSGKINTLYDLDGVL